MIEPQEIRWAHNFFAFFLRKTRQSGFGKATWGALLINLSSKKCEWPVSYANQLVESVIIKKNTFILLIHTLFQLRRQVWWLNQGHTMPSKIEYWDYSKWSWYFLGSQTPTCMNSQKKVSFSFITLLCIFIACTSDKVNYQ